MLIQDCKNCPSAIQPVCANDGKTYENSCKAVCKDLEVKYPGTCWYLSLKIKDFFY